MFLILFLPFLTIHLKNTTLGCEGIIKDGLNGAELVVKRYNHSGSERCYALRHKVYFTKGAGILYL
jgi:hypothetical protein